MGFIKVLKKDGTKKRWVHTPLLNGKGLRKPERKRKSKHNKAISKIKKGLAIERRIKFSGSHPFYSGMQWRILRAQVLCHFKNCCRCGSTYNLQVDHIKPRSKFPSLQYEYSNLQVLCERCNQLKSDFDFTDWRPKSSLD